jgi:anaerobic magnesium-protoporphyrin IX monomethyl ester cyclase|tara:strand:+ start:876 stop:2402 length:1527 start_codon:yes stop_codon:yes gene_type:complete
MAKLLFTLIGASSPGTKPLNTSLLSAVAERGGHETALFDTTFMDLGFELDTEVSNKISQFKKIDYDRYNLVRDSNINWKKEFIRVLKEEKPDIICASAMSDMFYYTVKFLTYMKEEGYDIPVICGGIHPTLQPDDAISHDCVDYIVIGEGEDVLLPLVDSILDKEDPSYMTKVPVWYKKDGKIVKTLGNSLVDLDGLPVLNYEFYDNRQFLRQFEGKVLRSGDVQTMRGCPRRCTYCANAELNKVYQTMEGWTGWRVFTPERFVEEAEYLVKKHKLEFFKFFDEDMLLRPEEDFAALSELYKKKVGIPFTMQTHPGTVTKKKVELLKDMNCASMTISMECGNNHYRMHELKRRYTNEKFIETINLVKDAGIPRVTALTMIGLPMESRKMIFETIDLARQSKPTHTNANIFFPYLGTPLGEKTVELGYANKTEIRISKFDASRTLLDMPQIDSEDIENIRKLWSFYVTWPKFMYPLFRWLEKDTTIRRSILSVLRKIEYAIKPFKKCTA